MCEAGRASSLLRRSLKATRENRRRGWSVPARVDQCERRCVCWRLTKSRLRQMWDSPALCTAPAWFVGVHARVPDAHVRVRGVQEPLSSRGSLPLRLSGVLVFAHCCRPFRDLYAVSSGARTRARHPHTRAGRRGAAVVAWKRAIRARVGFCAGARPRARDWLLCERAIHREHASSVGRRGTSWRELRSERAPSQSMQRGRGAP